MISVFENMDSKEHEEIVFCRDKDTGLKAIIAVQNPTIGTALGGRRMWNYRNMEAALKVAVKRMKYIAIIKNIYLPKKM